MNYVDLEIEKLAELPFYTEGPVMDSLGNCFFTTLGGEQILKIDPSGIRSVWAACSCPNGQFVQSNGDHMVCDSREGTVKRFSGEGIFLKNIVTGRCAALEVTTPNDLVADGAGNIYFTDSVRDLGRVFFIGADGTERVLAEKLDYPNGLVLSGDEQTLYVTESFQNRILKIDLRASRKETPQVLTELPRHPSGKKEDNLPDGMTIDCNGNLWVAHYGMGALQVVSSKGKWLCSVNTGLPLTSNVIFMNATTLLVTGGFGEPGPGAVLKIKL